MILVIAEKPSVANTIAKVLGVKGRKDGYIEGNGYIISWCVGHLVTLADTELYDEKYAKWSLSDLPIIPEQWEYVAQQGKEKQLDLVCKLLDRVDVKEVVNACDSGREGELIFKLVYNYSQSTLPIKRLWISSMEDKAISEGFQNLEENSKYKNLYQSAVCRQQADWLVGINGTRLFSVLYNQKLNVGRVMSPTLAMIVTRSHEIEKFKPTTFYKVKLKKDNMVFSTDKIDSEDVAKEILENCQDNDIIIENIVKKDKKENPPKLFDLTTLQRVCNRELGYTANETLSYVQKLYEKKLCTYPRTDSRFITDDMEDTVTELLEYAYEVQGFDGTPIINIDKVIDNSKVSDHHAIIPTANIKDYDFSQLEKGEIEVLRKINIQLICSVGDVYTYAETVVTATCGEHTFTIKANSPINLGFKAYLNNTTENDEDFEEDDDKLIDLSSLNIGDMLEHTNANIEDGQTKPPKQYTEDTLLSSMENAGKGNDIDKKFVGIGTPATRSSIIDKLENLKLIERVQVKGKKAKHLVPTKKGISLVTILPEKIKSSLTTAYWEEQLNEVEQGNISSDDFMSEINNMVSDLVKNYEVVAESEKLFESKYPKVGCCPRCSKNVVETPKTFTCEDRECGFTLWKENKFFQSIRKDLNKQIVVELLKKGKSCLRQCYSQKTGKTFECFISLEDTGKYINFKMEFDDNKKKKTTTRKKN